MLSGGTLDVEELEGSSGEDSGVIAHYVTNIKHWLLTHSQHLNFFTILVLASVSFIFCCSFSFIPVCYSFCDV